MSLDHALDALQQAESDSREWANVTYRLFREDGMTPSVAAAETIHRMRESIPRGTKDLATAMIHATMVRVTVEEIEDLLRREGSD